MVLVIKQIMCAVQYCMFYFVVTTMPNIPGGPCRPGGPGRPGLLRPGGPGGPVNVALNSAN